MQPILYKHKPGTGNTLVCYSSYVITSAQGVDREIFLFDYVIYMLLTESPVVFLSNALDSIVADDRIILWCTLGSSNARRKVYITNMANNT